MTDRKQALADLLEKVEAEGNAPFMPMADEQINSFDQRTIDLVQNAHNGSLDAAKALHEAVLPKWDCMMKWSSPAWVNLWKRGDIETASRRIRGTADGLARAWLIAIIKALIAKEGDT